jgi:predicted RNase H-like HicB family nuclease
MEEKNCFVDPEKKISLNIVVRTEQMGKKKVFIVNNEELGIADFGDTLEKALGNFKKSAKIYLETYPSKKHELEKQEPLLVSRIFL